MAQLHDSASIPFYHIDIADDSSYKYLLGHSWWHCRHYIILARDAAGLSPHFDLDNLPLIPKIHLPDLWQDWKHDEVVLRRRDAHYALVFGAKPDERYTAPLYPYAAQALMTK